MTKCHKPFKKNTQTCKKKKSEKKWETSKKSYNLV